MINLSLIKAHVEFAPDRAAVLTGNRCITWHELHNETEKKICYLLERFGQKFPVQACYISPNRPELISWLAAFSTLGIPVTGLDYTLSHSDLKKLLITLRADFILISTKTFDLGRAESGFGDNSSLLVDLNSTDFENGVYEKCDINGDISALLKGLGIPNTPFRSVGLTSGTTGMPKLVIRSRPFDQRRFAFFTNRYGFTFEDRFLVSMPLYHAAGNGWARMFMGLGATIYLASVDDPEELKNIIERQYITASVMTPSILREVLDAAESNATFKHTLKWVLVGGKHFPVQQKERALDQLGPIIHEYYGTTETGVNTIAEPHDLENHPRSVGLPFDGNAIAIIDPCGSRLGTEEIGTVAVASYMNMDSYSDGSSNSVTFDGKSYLLTSEKGYLDQEGRLYLLNRSSVSDNLYNIYGLEDAIRALPCIADVALMPSDNQSSSQVNCAIQIKYKTKAPSQLHDGIRKLVSTAQMQLLRYGVVPKIPYSPSGKVKVRDLELLLSGPCCNEYRS